MSALLFASDPRCPQCKDSGKCIECDGTGINTHLNENEPKCKNCSGTGECPSCDGEGRFLTPPSEVQNLGVNKR